MNSSPAVNASRYVPKTSEDSDLELLTEYDDFAQLFRHPVAVLIKQLDPATKVKLRQTIQIIIRDTYGHTAGHVLDQIELDDDPEGD